MIYFNTFPNSLDRHDAKDLSVEEIQKAVNIIDGAMKDAGYTKNDKEVNLVQNLIFNLENLMHFKSNVGGWKGLAKLQEIAGSIRWISVEDRTPNEQQEVLVLVDEEVFTAYYHGKPDGEDDWVIQGFIGSREINKVTHWQTLPELPKE